jgi:hypothetical protein
MLEYSVWMLAGTLYGFIFGLIPVAGAATALITVYSFLDVFRHDPYTLVVFTTSIVVSSTIGDSFSSVMLNVPGASGSAATMVDGFPLAKKGRGAYAVSAAVTTSAINGLIWGVLVFALLPFYGSIVLSFGIPEQLAFLVLAFTTVSFISSGYWFRSLMGLSLGVFAGMIGQDPLSGEPRFTLGWHYLEAGVQIIPILAGVLAFPELFQLYFSKFERVALKIDDYRKQVTNGVIDSFKYWKDGLRGGAIGAFIGTLPGIGGSVADWLAYSQTVAINNRETYGNGNIRGVIGCEGANNAQKATGYIPTVLFGIPAAPFEVIILSLFVLVGIELGTPALLKDRVFFDSLTYSYVASLILSFFLAMIAIKYVSRIFDVKIDYWFWPIVALVTWSCVQYTGYIEDYLILAACVALGFFLKHFKFGRASFIIGFVLSDRLEKLFYQYKSLFEPFDILTRPISSTLVLLAVIAATYGIFFNKAKVEYT